MSIRRETILTSGLGAVVGAALLFGAMRVGILDLAENPDSCEAFAALATPLAGQSAGGTPSQTTQPFLGALVSRVPPSSLAESKQVEYLRWTKLQRLFDDCLDAAID